MNQAPPLYPSEVALLKLLSILLTENRKSLRDRKISQLGSFSILRYIASVFDPESMRVLKYYASLQELADELRSECHEVDNNLWHEVEQSLHLYTVDDLFDCIEKIRTVFDVDNLASTNKLTGPTVICRDSILGHFYRNFFCQFDSLEFDGVCALHDLIAEFIGTGSRDESSLNLILESREVGLESPGVRSSPIEGILTENDSTAAEEELHKYFDISTVSANNDSSSSSHQLTMLSLAALWARHGRSGLARRAVEETMKVAHQKGDDATVAKAMLLLYYASSSAGPSYMSKEDILVKCIERCRDTNLPLLASHAGLLLVQERGALGLSSGGASSHHEPNNRRLAQNLWTTLHLSMYGDTKLLLRSIANESALLSSMSLGAAAAPGLNPKATGSSEPSLFTLKELGELRLPSALASVAVWTQGQQLHMTELQCRRTMRYLAGLKSLRGLEADHVASLHINLAKTLLDLHHPLLFMPRQQDTLLSHLSADNISTVFDTALLILSSVGAKSVLYARMSLPTRALLEATVLLVRARQALVELQQSALLAVRDDSLESALDSAQRLVDFTADTSSATGDKTLCNEDALQARLILALVTYYTSPTRATDELKSLSGGSSSNHTQQWDKGGCSGQANAYLNFVRLYRYSGTDKASIEDIRATLVQIKRVYEAARVSGDRKVQQLVSMQWAMYCKAIQR